MGVKKFIQFPYIFKDGERFTCSENLLVDCSCVTIVGVRTETAWYAQERKQQAVTGFFIDYEGSLYGSLEMNQQQFLASCRTECRNCSDFQIHVEQWVKQFA